MTGLAKMKRMPRRATLLARRLARDISGFAAVEFAMIVPVMIIMLLGCVEVSDASTVALRMINISGSVSDMVARCTNINSSDLNDIMRIADELLGKYTRSNLYIEVVAVQADANKNLTVAWSYDRNRGQPLAAGSAYNGLPPGLVAANSTLIVATSSYKYRSPVAQYIHGAVSLSHTAYNPPRGNLPVTYAAGGTSCTY